MEAETPSTPVKPRSLDVMPTPFAWIDIPEKGYSIAKYPITNAQFATFIEAGGYQQQGWWTETGWDAKLKGYVWGSKEHEWVETNQTWTEPRYWKDQRWNGAEHPVVGVSWYEVVAFCLWLSDVTGEKIMLPTEDQWQYAGQGDDGRSYPWGKVWDAGRCNNSVDSSPIGKKTTPVWQYEGKGDSPFGVVDMAGNVFEQCLTDFDDNTNNINSSSTFRVLRGGSWNGISTGDFCCDHRFRGKPPSRSVGVGFRVSRS